MIRNFVVAFFTLSLSLATGAYAHDGGHGPKIKKQGKYGGKVVVMTAKDGEAKNSYKGEMTRSSGGDLRLYVYGQDGSSKKMKSAKGKVTYRSKETGKEKNEAVEFEKKSTHFLASLPDDAGRSVNVSVEVKAGDATLTGTFKRLR